MPWLGVLAGQPWHAAQRRLGPPHCKLWPRERPSVYRFWTGDEDNSSKWRRERRDRSAFMVSHSERTHKPSTNAASACWMPRHWRQRSWLSTEDRKRPQPRGHGRNSIFKKTWTDRDFCSFRKSALLVEVPRGIAADRDTAVRTVTPTRTASRQMMNGFVEINTFIHLAPKQKSDEWMHLSPIYTRVHGEWLRYAKFTSHISLAFSLSQRWLGLPSKSPMSSRHNS